MEYKTKIYNKRRINKYKNLQTTVFIICVGLLAAICIISLNVAIVQGRISLNNKIVDEYTLAQDYYKNGNYIKARDILKKEIKETIDPKKEYEANILLGQVYNELGEYDTAINLFDSMTNSLYLDEKLKHNLSISYLRKGMHQEAITSLEETLKINSNYIPSLLTLGKFYIDNKLPRLAKGYYERVLEIEDNDEALFHVGVIALNEGLQSVAYNTLSKLVKIGSSEYADMAAAVLGDIYVTSGDTESAIEMYLKSLANSKNTTESLKRLVEIYEQTEDYESIRKVYEQVLEQNPNDVNGILAIGELYENENQYDKAVRYYSRLSRMKEYTNTYQAIGLLANAYYKSGDLKNAEANYKKILIVEKKDDLYNLALERLGDITYRQQSYISSLKYYQEIFKTTTNNSIFIPRLGELELYYGNSDVGVKLLQTAIRDNIGNAFPSRTLAMYYENIGNNNDAIKYYNYTINKYPKDRESIYRGGVLFYKTKNYDKAREALLTSANDENNTVTIRESAFVYLATMMEEIGRYNDATEYYRQLIDISPKVENYMLYGAFSYRRLQYEDAIYAYSEALSIAKDKKELFDINLSLGKCYFRINELDSAEESYRAALTINNSDIQAKEGLKQVLTKKQLMYNN